MYTVYMHISPSGKKYVGITSQTPEMRWKNGLGYTKKHQPAMYNAIQKYGWENFQHLILADSVSREFACQLEQIFIRDYDLQNPAHGYNLSSGGEQSSFGIKRSDDFKNKLRLANTGKVLSEDHRRKLREAKLGKPYMCSPETRAKQRQTRMRNRDLNVYADCKHIWMSNGSDVVKASPGQVQMYLVMGYHIGKVPTNI